MSGHPGTRGRGRPPKYPLRQMRVGESVFLGGTTQLKINKVRKVYKPMKFRCRSVVSSGVVGVRVWRVA